MTSTALRQIEPPPAVLAAFRWVRSARWRVSIVASLFVGVCGLLTYLWAHWYTGPHVHQFDLQIYFRAIRYWANGQDIYDYAQFDRVQGSLGFTYPPFAAVLMYPLSLVSWPVVTGAMEIVNIVTAAFCVFLCLRARFNWGNRTMLFAVGVATCAAFNLEPIRETLAFGQINLVLAALVLGDLLVLSKYRSKWTGIGVGLAMAIKLTPGIFLLYLVLNRQWRGVLVALGTALLASLAAALVAPAETWEFFTSLLWQSDRVGFPGHAANQSINGLLARFAYPGQPSHVVWLICALVVTVPAIWRIRVALRLGDQLAAVTFTGMLGVLVSPVSWTHHLVWVVPAVVIIAAQLVEAIRRSVLLPPVRGRAAIERLRPLAGTIALALSGIVALGFDPRRVFDLPDVDYSNLSGLSVVLASVPMLWCAAVLFVLPLRASRTIRPSSVRAETAHALRLAAVDPV